MATSAPSSPVEPGIDQDEASRLAALRNLCILDTPPEESFDGITRLAAKTMQVPILLLSLMDECRQWFKSKVGLDASETPREISFCTHTISGREPLVVCDTLLDQRFANNPLVVDEPRIRAYLGVPIYSRAGHAIGTLCAIDRRPRNFGAEHVETMSNCAKAVQGILHSREFHASLERGIALRTAALQTERAEREREIARRKKSETQLRDSRERQRLFIDHAPTSMAMFDRQMRYIAVSRRWLDENFQRDEDVVGRGHYEVFPDLPDSYKSLHARAMSGDVVRREEERVELRDGSVRWANWEIRPWYAEDGSVGGIVIFAQDVTKLKMAADELRIAAVALESREAIVISGNDDRILRVNQAFTVLTGFAAQEMIGTPVRGLNDARQDPAVIQALARQISTSGHWQGELWTRRKNGNPFIARGSITAVRAPSGEITHYVSSFSDVTEAKQAEEKIHTLAYFDPLTQLPNRRLLYDRMSQIMAGNRRSGRMSAALFLDLDNFKVLNDTRGHNVGDELLVIAAKRIQANVRGHDTVARLGGDEFVVIISDLGEDAQAAAVYAGAVGETLREALARPYHIDEREYHSPASLGITLFRGEEETVETVLKHADLAMYQAKGAGRNTARFFDPAMQIALDRRSALESDLRLALQLGQLRLYYQPQLEQDGKIFGAEALLRWVHHEHGMILPGSFISLAEETGLILPIGLWVLQTACAQLVAWSKNAAMRDLRLAVNVSALQFHLPEFVALVANVVQRTGADPTRLTMEITESVVLKDVDDTLAKMKDLKSLGIRFSLDDFGTGNSSLSYLSKLPLDVLKIDKSFVASLPDSRNDAIIAQTIITMGTSLGLQVIAEGVETVEQRAFLHLHGCNSHQGYLYSRPLPLLEFAQFVAASAQGGREASPSVIA
ncbi:MAG: EAL domain-containing protein [Steroidobacteraceae bacterium]